MQIVRDEIGDHFRLLAQGAVPTLQQGARPPVVLSRLELRLHENGLSPIEASKVIDRSIFCLDVYKLLSWSDGVVINLNGRVPDEGTVVEAALAWHAGKPLVLYKNDSRAPFLGRDNPI